MKTRPMVTLEDCRTVSAAAEADARKNGWNVCIAILDDGGHHASPRPHGWGEPGERAYRNRKRPHRGGNAPLHRRSAGAHQDTARFDALGASKR